VGIFAGGGATTGGRDARPGGGGGKREGLDGAAGKGAVPEAVGMAPGENGPGAEAAGTAAGENGPGVEAEGTAAGENGPGVEAEGTAAGGNVPGAEAAGGGAPGEVATGIAAGAVTPRSVRFPTSSAGARIEGGGGGTLRPEGGRGGAPFFPRSSKISRSAPPFSFCAIARVSSTCRILIILGALSSSNMRLCLAPSAPRLPTTSYQLRRV
jgi:hypothetical protein